MKRREAVQPKHGELTTTGFEMLLLHRSVGDVFYRQQLRAPGREKEWKRG